MESQEFVELLSISAQQIAKVVSNKPEIAAEQAALLNQIVAVDSITATYDPRISESMV